MADANAQNVRPGPGGSVITSYLAAGFNIGDSATFKIRNCDGFPRIQLNMRDSSGSITFDVTIYKRVAGQLIYMFADTAITGEFQMMMGGSNYWQDYTSKPNYNRPFTTGSATGYEMTVTRPGGAAGAVNLLLTVTRYPNA
jgi:hypothetical protein